MKIEDMQEISFMKEEKQATIRGEMGYTFVANATLAHKNGNAGIYTVEVMSDKPAIVKIIDSTERVLLQSNDAVTYYNITTYLEHMERYGVVLELPGAVKVSTSKVYVTYDLGLDTTDSDGCDCCDNSGTNIIVHELDVVAREFPNLQLTPCYVRNHRAFFHFTANENPNDPDSEDPEMYHIEAIGTENMYLFAYNSESRIIGSTPAASRNPCLHVMLAPGESCEYKVVIDNIPESQILTSVMYEPNGVSPESSPSDRESIAVIENKSTESKFADPVDVYSGAHTLVNTIMKLNGGQNLTFTARYNSTLIANGSLGFGWYHDYEKRIALECNCGTQFRVYEKPCSYNVYTYDGRVDGYTCPAVGKSGYVLRLTNEGYELNCNSERKEYYNIDGMLTKIVNKHGFVTNVEYSGVFVVITDEVSGRSIYLEKDNDGKIITVMDNAGRYAKLTYKNGFLINVDDVNSNKLVYLYDTYGKMESGIDSNNIAYFKNTYSDGKIVSQVDGKANPASTFVYGTGADANKRYTTNRLGKESVREFNDAGLLSKYTDENGNVKTYTYDSNGNVTSETDGRGNTKRTEYNSFNKPTKITDKNGNITLFEYDTVGNLLKITHPNTGIETFEYNERNQMTKHTDLRGTVTLYTYDNNGMPASKKVGDRNAITYVYTNGLLMSETDAKGNTTTYAYNAYGQMTRKTDALNNVTKYEYDRFGNVLKIIDANGKVVTYTYDCNYQKISVKDANGNTTRYTYTPNLKPDMTELPDGNYSYNAYDAEDRVIKSVDTENNETLYTYDDGGRMTRIEYPDGSTVNYTYDNAGNVLTERNPKGAVTTKEYDAAGNVTTLTDGFGNITRNSYDCMSRVIRSVSAVSGATVYEYSLAGDLFSETDPLNNKTIYTYDAYGNRLTVTDPKGNVTTFTYDANNNVTSKTDALNNVTTYSYDACNRLVSVTNAKNQTVTYGYDAVGRRVSVTDAKGKTVTTVYDANGNVLNIKDAKGVTVSTKMYNNRNLMTLETDAEGGRTEYVYSPLGHNSMMIKFIDPSNLNDNEFKVINHFGYNYRGQIISSSSNDEVSRAVYDTLGNTTSLTGPLGASTTYVYDAMGRMLSKSTVSGGTVEYQYNELSLKNQIKNARNQTHNFTYDIKGRIVGCVTPEDTVSYTYDANGNITIVTDSRGNTIRTFDALNRVTSVTDPYGNTIGYRYDSVGNRTAIVYPDETEVTYTYDANNNLVSVTDWSGRTTTYTYDVNNMVTGITKPDGTVTTNAYDYVHRLVSTVTRTSDETIISGFEYEYDGLGRIVTEDDLANNTLKCYTYDKLSRIIKCEKTDLSTHETTEDVFTYDAAGNITSDSDHTYGTNNRLTYVANYPITYDLDGNMLGMCLNNSEMSFTYDSSNRLTSAGGCTYTYNAEDVRIKKVMGESETTYVYDTREKLSKLLVKCTDGVYIKYVYGLGLIGEESITGFKTYHYDYRGSTVAITDAASTVTDTFTYDTYGKLTSRTGTTDTPFMYNGRDGVMTDENGLYYMRARYYHPEIKRFINADIVAGKISNAITLNRFAYADGNPVSNIDPFGLSVERGDYEHGVIMYQGLPYSIYVPDQSTTTIGAVWETVYDETVTLLVFDSDQLIANLVDLELEDGSAPGFTLGRAAIESLQGVADEYKLTYTFQEQNGNRRVIITAFSPNVDETYSIIADNTTRYLSSVGNNSDVSDGVRSMYLKETGSLFAFHDRYDLSITLDSQHKEGPYAYISKSEDGNLLETPIVYPNDKVTIVARQGFLDSEIIPLCDIPMYRSYNADPVYSLMFKDTF